MTHLTQPIGLLGGTFDPVHQGHIQIAHEILQAYHLAEVRFIPCWQPVHRSAPIATPEQRLAMLSYALKNEPALKLDDCEIKRKGLSYTIDTIEFLRQQFPSAPLCLIIGADAWHGFPEWHRYQDILRLAHVIIATRPNHELSRSGKSADLLQQYQTENKSVLQASLAGNIFVHSLTAIDISATAIRDQLAKGQHPLDLPNAVHEYIVKQHLYSEK